MIRFGWSCRLRAAGMALVAVALSGWAATAHAGALFGMADAAALVFRGTVETVTPYEKAKLTVYRIRVGRALAGDVGAGETVDLAQEMLFGTTQPYFRVGTETLVFAVPLPDYSSFREALPAGRYWRWVDRLETAADLAPLGDPALVDAVDAYLQHREDPEALADFVVQAITGPSRRVREDALTFAGKRRDLSRLLDARRLAPLAAWLRDERTPVPERAGVLVGLARLGAPGVVDLAQPLTTDSGPLQAPAIDALVTLDRPPPDEQLLAWSGSRDAALRLVAGRGLARSGSDAAIDRIGAMLESEGTGEVRVELVKAIGRTRSPRIVPLLAAELAKNEKEVANAAADALVKQNTDPAVAALAEALEHGPENAQVAAAFALKRMNRLDAEQILARVEETHPDPKVRRLCKVARGESLHEH